MTNETLLFWGGYLLVGIAIVIRATRRKPHKDAIDAFVSTACVLLWPLVLVLVVLHEKGKR